MEGVYFKLSNPALYNALYNAIQNFFHVLAVRGDTYASHVEHKCFQSCWDVIPVNTTSYRYMRCAGFLCFQEKKVAPSDASVPLLTAVVLCPRLR